MVNKYFRCFFPRKQEHCTCNIVYYIFRNVSRISIILSTFYRKKSEEHFTVIAWKIQNSKPNHPWIKKTKFFFFVESMKKKLNVQNRLINVQKITSRTLDNGYPNKSHPLLRRSDPRHVRTEKQKLYCCALIVYVPSPHSESAKRRWQFSRFRTSSVQVRPPPHVLPRQSLSFRFVGPATCIKALTHASLHLTG